LTVLFDRLVKIPVTLKRILEKIIARKTGPHFRRRM
jgi:hypothetical protein